MQYNAIPCNTMHYNASSITADGAYHCPVGSVMAIFSQIWDICDILHVYFWDRLQNGIHAQENDFSNQVLSIFVGTDGHYLHSQNLKWFGFTYHQWVSYKGSDQSQILKTLKDNFFNVFFAEEANGIYLGSSPWEVAKVIADLKALTTRPSVNCAKDWLDHSFLIPGLVWSEKVFHFGCDH